MNDKKNGARPVPDFSVFDGQCLLGLDRLGLRARCMRFLDRGNGSGVWQIRCETGDESARVCLVRLCVPGAHLARTHCRARAVGIGCDLCFSNLRSAL